MSTTAEKNDDAPVVCDYDLALEADDDLVSGHQLIKNKQYRPAFDAYVRSAIKGNREALGLVGTCYLNGIGVKRDIEKAAYHYGRLVITGVPTRIYDPRLCRPNGTFSDGSSVDGPITRRVR